MSRHIDSDVAIDKVGCLFRDTERDKGNFMLIGYNHAVADCIAILKNLDVVEVVRCKDCKWWGAERFCENSDSPCFQNGCTHGNWFCADGEEVTK